MTNESPSKPSRQREWQRAKIARGTCSICGNAKLYRDERCAYHFMVKYLRKRGVKPPEATIRALAKQVWVERAHWRRYWAANRDLLPPR